jgi:hypothetical protein
VNDFQAGFLERCAKLENAEIGEGAFRPGAAVWLGKREIVHFDGERTLDVRLTKEAIRARRAEFKADTRIRLRPGSSDWLEIHLGNESDVGFALTLVRDAIVANLPTAPLGPPPTGAELERRRRFH